MEKRCGSCKKFKNLNNYSNDSDFCVTRRYFKLCCDCRERARRYQINYRVKNIEPKQKYNKRVSEYRESSDYHRDVYEVEPDIMYNPNTSVCFCDPCDLSFICWGTSFVRI